MPAARPVFYISDRTGITVETLGHALLSQFEVFQCTETMLPFVDSRAKVLEAVATIDHAADACGERPLVFATLVDEEYQVLLAQCKGMVVDFFQSFVGRLEEELASPSSHRVGGTHGVGDLGRYDQRMDTVNFALGTDDGSGALQYEDADIIVVGVSRSGKTPTCLYLALQFGIRAANYPITEEHLEDARLPAALEPHRARLYGLMIDAERLQRIRSERRPDSRYASMPQCQYELRQLRALFERQDIPFVDSTSMSIEEIATSILHAAGLRRRG